MFSSTSLPVLKNQCDSPQTHSYKKICICPKTKWFTSKDLWDMALYFDLTNIYPSKKEINKVAFSNKLSLLFKSQLVAGCIQYSLYETPEVAFSKTKKELSDSILDFIQTNILLCNELCYLNIPISYYNIDWDKWNCQECQKEYTYLNSLCVRPACSDDNIFGDRCCVAVVCQPTNEFCTYIEPEYRG